MIPNKQKLWRPCQPLPPPPGSSRMTPKTAAAMAPGCLDPGSPRMTPGLPASSPKSNIVRQIIYKTCFQCRHKLADQDDGRIFCRMMTRMIKKNNALRKKNLRPEIPTILYCRMIGPSVGWYHPKITHHPGFTYRPDIGKVKFV